MIESLVAASAARTTTGNGTDTDTLKGQEKSWAGKARFWLNVSAASGTTPNLVASIQALVNGRWATLASFAAKTAAGEETVLVEGCPPVVRAAWTITGTTPSFTFEVNCIRE